MDAMTTSRENRRSQTPPSTELTLSDPELTSGTERDLCAKPFLLAENEKEYADGDPQQRQGRRIPVSITHLSSFAGAKNSNGLSAATFQCFLSFRTSSQWTISRRRSIGPSCTRLLTSRYQSKSAVRLVSSPSSCKISIEEVTSV